MTTKFSFSKISKFKQCPRAYEFMYRLDERERFSTIERLMGSAVHEALCWAYAENRQAETDEVLEQYQVYWGAADLEEFVVIKTGLTREDYRLVGEQLVTDYLERVYKNDTSTTLALEKRFEIDLGDGIRFRGIVDRLARTGSGTLRLIDYKTGKRPMDPRTDVQLAFYAIYVLQEYQDDGVELVYENLRNSSATTLAFRREEIPAHIETIVSEINKITETENYVASPSMLCHWCGFNPICEDALEPRTPRPGGTGSKQCPTCGKSLKQRQGKFGSFIGCSGYPGCKYTRNSL